MICQLCTKGDAMRIKLLDTSHNALSIFTVWTHKPYSLLRIAYRRGAGGSIQYLFFFWYHWGKV